MIEQVTDSSSILQRAVRYDPDKKLISCCPENISYDGCMIDAALELFWHTDEAKVVGIKIHLTPEEFSAYRDSSEFVSLAQVLNEIYEKLRPTYQSCSQSCRERFYQIALRIVGDAMNPLPSSERPSATE
jgi:hypothetical protein